MGNFFSHDSNARNSDRLIPLRAKLGAEGYGIYFMLLERLREEPDYTSIKDYNMLAFDLRVDAAKVKAVVELFGLFSFTDDGKRFYSEGFLKRMQLKDEKSEKARQSAIKRWERKQSQSECNANALRTDGKDDAMKEKKSKENNISHSLAREERLSDLSDSTSVAIPSIPQSPPGCAAPPVEAVVPVERLREEFDRRGETFALLIINALRGTGRLSQADVWSWLDRFTQELRARGEELKTTKDYQSHFVNWLKIQLQKHPAHGNNQNGTTNRSDDELTANERRYGSTRETKRSIDARVARLSAKVKEGVR